MIDQKRFKEAIEMMQLPSLFQKLQSGTLDTNDLLTDQEQLDLFWNDYTEVAENVISNIKLRFSQQRQLLYYFDKCWIRIDNADKRNIITDYLFNLAESQGYPTHKIKEGPILHEIRMRASVFPAEENDREVMQQTRYTYYLFPNGTLTVDENINYTFKSEFDPENNIREEENPIFRFEFVEDKPNIKNIYKIFKEWMISPKMFMHFISYVLFFKKDFLNILLYLVGVGQNGKSQAIKILEEIVPSGTATSLDLSKLSGDKDGSQVLENVYINTSGEIKLDDFDTTFFKKITGGDRISVNVKMQPKPVTFVATAKHIVSSNYVPRVKTTTLGDLRRIRVISFKKKFPLQNGWFDSKIRPYLPQVFFAALLVAKKIKNKGFYFNSKTVEDSNNTIREESNSAYTFIKEFGLIYTANTNSTLDERPIYYKYKIWCKINGKSPYANSRFWNEVDQIIGSTKGSTRFSRMVDIQFMDDLSKIAKEDI